MEEASRSPPPDRMVCPNCQADLICQLCHDLQPCTTTSMGLELPHRDWVLAISVGSCQGCFIIRSILERIEPALLADPGRFSNHKMCIEVPQLSGCISIVDFYEGYYSTAARFQLYSPEGMRIWLLYLLTILR